ncbi:MAG: ArsI/CadI family heavy metal resistance metalloenzyme [Pseudomonadota bacterium]
MKRLHIHIKTDDLEKSVDFYTAMFGVGPDQQKDDYAKWLLDDPAANIAVSTKCGARGVDHVGLSLDSGAELDAIAERLGAEGASLMKQDQTTCCYATSDKYWARDPQGAVWELFRTFGDSETFGAQPDRSVLAAHAVKQHACC